MSFRGQHLEDPEGVKFSPVAQPLPVVQLHGRPEQVPAAPLPHDLAERDRPPAVHHGGEDSRDDVDQVLRGVALTKRSGTEGKVCTGNCRGAGNRRIMAPISRSRVDRRP